jgi:hypothetical protein
MSQRLLNGLERELAIYSSQECSVARIGNGLELFYRVSMSNYRGHTSLGGPERQFPLTQWTKIADPGQRQAILAELCERYWKPLYTYLRARGFSNEDAKDLVQGFFTERVLGREFIGRVDRTKGRFRNFLLVALRHYVINVQKKTRKPVRFDEESEEPTIDDSAEDEFSRAWADTLLQEVLQELELEYHRKGQDSYWQLFHEWLLEPRIGDDRKDMTLIGSKCGFVNPAHAYRVICRMKARFREVLRGRLRTLAGSEMEIDREINEFISLFSKK